MMDREIRIVDELQATDLLAYKYKDAARVIGLSYGSLHNEMLLGHIRNLEGWKLISRDELLRWVKEREQKPVPRKRARRIDAPASETIALNE